MAAVHGPSPMDEPVRPRHLLGPQVVGQRIVVRRIVRGETGPSGGPALTDLLGTCLAWTGESCVVQPETGAAVTIALADIVSGKPVPPRAATRMRVSPREAELHTAALWSSVEVQQLGEWQLRVDTAPTGRRRKRANSCLAMGDPNRPIADALAAVETFYAEHARAPLAQVEAGSTAESDVIAAGWERLQVGESAFLLASVARVRRALAPASESVGLDISGPRALASIASIGGSDPDAEGRAGIDGDWIGLHGVAVDPSQRRRGLATAIVGELLDWGAEQGAMTAWLHVETDNPGGLAFWEALGFTEHHGCRYYVPPSSSSASPVSR